MPSTKSTIGNFFEDFRLGRIIEHATPRTITSGDVALYTALYGSRFAVQSSDEFARAIGYPRAPVDDLLMAPDPTTYVVSLEKRTLFDNSN